MHSIAAVLIVTAIDSEVGGCRASRSATVGPAAPRTPGAAFVLSIGPPANGAGTVSTGHHDAVSLGMLIGGLAVGAVCVLLAMRHHRRHKARQSAPGNAAVASQGASRPGVTRCSRLPSDEHVHRRAAP